MNKEKENINYEVDKMKAENPSHSYSEGADVLSMGQTVQPKRSEVIDDLRAQLEASEKRVKELEQDIAAGHELLQEYQLKTRRQEESFSEIRRMVLNSFNQITDADNPYQALERAFDKLAIR